MIAGCAPGFSIEVIENKFAWPSAVRSSAWLDLITASLLHLWHLKPGLLDALHFSNQARTKILERSDIATHVKPLFPGVLLAAVRISTDNSIRLQKLVAAVVTLRPVTELSRRKERLNQDAIRTKLTLEAARTEVATVTGTCKTPQPE